MATMVLSFSPRSPIASLPPETLVATLCEVTRDPVELIQLALVCRSWRDIVFETGELWTRVIITKNTSEVQLRRQMQLSRQALLALDLDWEVPSTLASLALGWNSPTPIVERVRSLKASMPYDEGEPSDVSVWQPLFEGRTWLQLTTLVVISSHRTLRVRIRAPNLETIELGQAYFHDWRYIGLGSALCDVRWMNMDQMRAWQRS